MLFPYNIDNNNNNKNNNNNNFYHLFVHDYIYWRVAKGLCVTCGLGPKLVHDVIRQFMIITLSKLHLKRQKNKNKRQLVQLARDPFLPPEVKNVAFA